MTTHEELLRDARLAWVRKLGREGYRNYPTPSEFMAFEEGFRAALSRPVEGEAGELVKTLRKMAAMNWAVLYEWDDVLIKAASFIEHAAPRENKAEVASEEARLSATDSGVSLLAPDSTSRSLPNNPAGAAPNYVQVPRESICLSKEAVRIARLADQLPSGQGHYQIKVLAREILRLRPSAKEMLSAAEAKGDK